MTADIMREEETRNMSFGFQANSNTSPNQDKIVYAHV